MKLILALLITLSSFQIAFSQEPPETISLMFKSINKLNINPFFKNISLIGEYDPSSSDSIVFYSLHLNFEFTNLENNVNRFYQFITYDINNISFFSKKFTSTELFSLPSDTSKVFYKKYNYTQVIIFNEFNFRMAKDDAPEMKLKIHFPDILNADNKVLYNRSTIEMITKTKID